jgi:hypothetical protein
VHPVPADCGYSGMIVASGWKLPGIEIRFLTVTGLGEYLDILFIAMRLTLCRVRIPIEPVIFFFGPRL